MFSLVSHPRPVHGLIHSYVALPHKTMAPLLMIHYLNLFLDFIPHHVHTRSTLIFHNHIYPLAHVPYRHAFLHRSILKYQYSGRFCIL